MQIRELTGRERQAIRRQVKEWCANYDNDYGCLPLDCECFMFGKAYSGGALCKWFRDAVLPLDAGLERIFTGGIAPDTKPCAVCGTAFPLNGRQIYCSDKCAAVGRRKSVAGNVRAYRERKRKCNHLEANKGRNSKAFEPQNNEPNTNYTKGAELCHKN
jgi:hypothetical protein